MQITVVLPVRCKPSVSISRPTPSQLLNTNVLSDHIHLHMSWATFLGSRIIKVKVAPASTPTPMDGDRVLVPTDPSCPILLVLACLSGLILMLLMLAMHAEMLWMLIM